MNRALDTAGSGFRRWLAYSLMALVALSACAAPTYAPASTPAPTPVPGCIPPPASIAFPVYATRGPGSLPTPVPMSPEFEPQLSDEQRQTFNSYAVVSLVARSSDDIWIAAASDRPVIRYQPSAQTVVTYTVKIDDKEVAPDGLLLSRDGTLWGIDYGVHVPCFLSRYDVRSDRFVLVCDENCILVKNDYDVVRAAEDSRGDLWFVINTDSADSPCEPRDTASETMPVSAVVRYNPSTNRAERMLTEDRGFLYGDIAIASDDTVWLVVVHRDDEPPRDGLIYRYDPRTDELKNYGMPPDVSYTDIFLYFDRAERLWLDEMAWLEISASGQGTWYEVFHSPVFLTDRIGGGEWQYAWTGSFQTYESSNGLFWFASGAGLVRLDPANGEWCLMTTLSSPIAEDDQGNLWLAGDGQIYKYRLRP